ncbi:MAG: hypothetical protein LPK88_06455 [Alphaproteobacteria bacterium]|nr:hypothetical protein [Alphaproteobacteria bacterium]MDX5415948.1 hypothetical protein [Alphaproteobacteria bacterium]MDX5493245.1 hypothetical protein [Alphaproteobacteria bacterium]
MPFSISIRGLSAAAATFAALTLLPSVALAEAVLQGGTERLAEGESAIFKITGAESGPADLNAQCDIGDVGGTASITFDGENYVPLSDPSVGTVLTLSRGETRSYSLSGVVDASRGADAYIAFHFTGAPAPMCFPGMDCGGAEGKAASVTVTCRNGAG